MIPYFDLRQIQSKAQRVILPPPVVMRRSIQTIYERDIVSWSPSRWPPGKSGVALLDKDGDLAVQWGDSSLKLSSLEQVKKSSAELGGAGKVERIPPFVDEGITIFIPVNYWPEPPREEILLQRLNHQLVNRPKVQGVRRRTTDIINQIESIKEDFVPGIPPLPKEIMRRTYGIAVGEKNNPRSRVQPLDIPKEWRKLSWEMAPMSYLITGIYSIHPNNIPIFWGTRYSQSTGNPALTPQGNILLLKMRPVINTGLFSVHIGPGGQRIPSLLRDVKKGTFSKPQLNHMFKTLVDDLLEMIKVTNTNRNKNLLSINSAYSDLKFFPAGIITKAKDSSTAYHWHHGPQFPFTVGKYGVNGNVIPSIASKINWYEDISIPSTGEPKSANMINFADFAKSWNTYEE